MRFALPDFGSVTTQSEALFFAPDLKSSILMDAASSTGNMKPIEKRASRCSKDC
jgi:hypothetical protein